jgi:HD superfamily phosphodiesterase
VLSNQKKKQKKKNRMTEMNDVREKRLQESCRNFLIGRDKSHGYEHAHTVARKAKHLAKDWPELNQEDLWNLQVLTYTHDFFDPKYFQPKDREKRTQGETIIKANLEDLSLDVALQIIERASWSNEQKQIAERGGKRDWYEMDLGWTRSMLILRHILSDADKLDAINEDGLERCATYVRHRWLPTASQEEVYEKVVTHAHEKLLRIKDYLHSPQAILEGKKYTEQMEKDLALWDPAGISETEIHLLGTALNIEGGSPFLNLYKNNPKALGWANVILVLDRPLYGTTFEQIEKIAAEQKYPILENTILEINEHQAYATYLHIIYYYLCKFVEKKYETLLTMKEKKKPSAKTRKRKMGSKSLVIGIHIHQFPDAAKYHIEQFRKFIHSLKWDEEVNFVFLHDTPTYFWTKVDEYDKLDILLSFSQAAGLSSEYREGDLLVTDQFIPCDFTEKVARLNKKYNVSNDLTDENIWPQVFGESVTSAKIIDTVNKEYVSKNVEKRKHKATRENLKLHKVPKVVQVNGIWNPSGESSKKIKVFHY